MSQTTRDTPGDPEGYVRRNKRTFVARLVAGVAVAGAVALALLLTGQGEVLWQLFSDRERIQRLVEGAGILAPAVYLALLVVQAVVAPLPAPAVAMAGGYTFGTLEGFLLTWSGALLGGVLSFGISRLFGRGFVASNARMERLDRYVAAHGAILVFVLRLIPLVSFDAISYAAGLSGMSFGKFLFATALGMAPGTFVFVYLGGATPGMGVWAALIGLAVLAVAAYAYLRLRLRYRSRTLR
jgi:uncharacterized membrane protein YdjX (TVP38/TMEM64 family)